MPHIEYFKGRIGIVELYSKYIMYVKDGNTVKIDVEVV